VPDDTLFIIDTGASITITHNKYDFIGPVYPTQTMEIQGITAGLAIEGTGAAEYAFPTVADLAPSVTHPKDGCPFAMPATPCSFYLMRGRWIQIHLPSRTPRLPQQTNQSTIQWGYGSPMYYIGWQCGNVPQLLCTCCHPGYLASATRCSPPSYRNLEFCVAP